MTKIKLEVESDKDIAQANLTFKYADGTQITKEVLNTEVPVNTNTKSTDKPKPDDKKYKKGVDASFTQVY